MWWPRGGCRGLQEAFWPRHLGIIFYRLQFISRIFCINKCFLGYAALINETKGPQKSQELRKTSQFFSHSTFWLISFGPPSGTHAEGTALIWNTPSSWWKEKRNDGAVMAHKVLAANWQSSLTVTFLWLQLSQSRSLQVTCQQAGYKNYSQSHLPFQVRLSCDKGTILQNQSQFTSFH